MEINKRKYYLIGVLILIVAIIGYHFLAASQAEQQIDEALREYDDQEETISITHSGISITPFSADVSIDELNVIFGDHIERAKQLTIDLGYWDFLNIYFGGTEYGLQHLDHAIITTINPSYTNRNTRQETKSDNLTITYRGNALDGLQNAINGTTFSTNHSLNLKSENVTFSYPNTLLTKIKGQDLHYSGSIGESQKNFWLNGSHDIRLDSIIWTPPESFQNKYNFIIKGFGYETNAIPFEHAEINSHPSSLADTLEINSRLKSELALLTASGLILPNQPFGNSQIDEAQIALSDFSEQFNNILSNLEQLLGTSLPKENGSVIFTVSGTVSDPKITQ